MCISNRFPKHCEFQPSPNHMHLESSSLAREFPTIFQRYSPKTPTSFQRPLNPLPPYSLRFIMELPGSHRKSRHTPLTAEAAVTKLLETSKLICSRKGVKQREGTRIQEAQVRGEFVIKGNLED
ncbi:hypothetical protein VC83_05925 [Pseudogymnoascus destructans]|uniref:Uncharacterized protein n=1 Tax=Pseudogymnoascus destructans TaxID=655981 RepID=A0A177A469_9PEZI|nr:uncharacterized protein VC83_05925 [Pseudogymnoascus destructans]OAF57089.1 hypothetical protein VC83_05925 [Pseudogymnoascus destructans]